MANGKRRGPQPFHADRSRLGTFADRRQKAREESRKFCETIAGRELVGRYIAELARDARERKIRELRNKNPA